MRKFNTVSIIVLFFTVVLAITSCKKDDKATPLTSIDGDYNGLIKLSASGAKIFEGDSKITIKYLGDNKTNLTISGIVYNGLPITQTVEVFVNTNKERNIFIGKFVLPIPGSPLETTLSGYENNGILFISFSATIPIQINSVFEGKR